MNKLYSLLLGSVLLLNLSCESDAIENESIIDNTNEVVTRASFYCLNGYCKPLMSFYRNGSFVSVQWESSAPGNDHRTTLTCSSAFFYKRESISPYSGAWTFSVSNDEPCDLTYSAYCSESSCPNCKQEGNVRLLSDGTVIKGSNTECFMRYLSYNIENVQGETLTLALSIYEEGLNQPDKCMEFDGARVYKHTPNGEQLQWAYINKISPYKIKFTLPNDPNSFYRINFFSSRCKHNDEHYVELRYSSGNMGINLSSVNLERINAHSQ